MPQRAKHAGRHALTGESLAKPDQVRNHKSVPPVAMIGRLFSLFIVLVTVSSCASRQAHIDDLAEQATLKRDIVSSQDGLSHLLYTNAAYQSLLSQHDNAASANINLHIYLEGDGIPWVQPHIVAVDPTPKSPLALKLMLKDKQASWYLGRPCYHGFYQQAGCHPLLWTQARYSEKVVDSMLGALTSKLEADHYLKDGSPRQQRLTLNLIGYSGGGVIAMLLAQRLQEKKYVSAVSVITVAANLDIDAWTDLHQYSRLSLSINPATQPQRYHEIEQFHFYGEQDDNVPAQLLSPLIARFGQNAHWIAIAKADHACCWETLWPDLLKQVTTSH